MGKDELRALLIEDDEDDYILMGELLSEVNGGRFDLVWARTYDRALEMLDGNGVDVALVDYRLGTRDGLDLVREARASGCTTPFILLAGQGDHEVDIAAMEVGVADYLVKDEIDASILERSIRYAVEHGRSRRLLQALNWAALAMEQALTPEEIFAAVGQELSKLGFHSLILVADGSRSVLVPRYVSYAPGVLRAAEKLTGIRHEDYQIPIEDVEVYADVVQDRKTILVEDPEKVTRQALPAPAKKLTGHLFRLLNSPRVIEAPLIIEDEVAGLLSVQSKDLTEADIPAITAFAHQVAAAWRRTQSFKRKHAKDALRKSTLDLGERVKELRCLYHISGLIEKQDTSLEGVLQGTVDFIPPAWQYPEVTCARILLDGQQFRTENFREVLWKQASDIMVDGERVGAVEVYYLEERPECYEGPFLEEERHLIDAIAERMGRVTERKRTEDEIRANLAEKEVLLREIHHRVKNNLQVISSLLTFQSNALENEEATQAFQESKNRIHAMARVHEHLHRSENLAQIDMADYIKGLVRHLRQSHGAYRVIPRVEVADVTLDVDTAMPCSLLINELVSNALKYAFPTQEEAGPDTPRGEIHIALRPEGDALVLTVSDDGVGLPADVDIEATQSLGLRLVGVLTRQLQGTLEVDRGRENGTSFKVTFSVPA